MADHGDSVVWIDANGRTRQMIIKSLAGAGGIIATQLPLSNAVVQSTWGGLLSIGVNHPVAANYQAVADAAEFLFQTASGSILRITIPSFVISAMKADKVTVDPTNASVVIFVNQCIGSLSDGAGNAASVFLGGRYIRGSRTDLDTP